MQKTWDVIIVGAGPAGLSCCSTAAEAGLSVLVLDEQRSPGGQIYRNIEEQDPALLAMLGKEYQHGLTLVHRFRTSGANYLPLSKVWNIEEDGRVSFSRNGKSNEYRAKRVVIAIGAMERPAPFPGWTLPGVMGVGGVDALLKSDGLVPDGPVTMVGNGPIMLLVAGHLHKLGIEIATYFDTSSPSSLISALPHLPRALRRPGYLLSGAGMLANTLRNVTNYKRNTTRYQASGTDRVNTLTVTSGSSTTSHEVSTLLVHEGIIPRTEFSRNLSLPHNWDTVQRCWLPQVDRDGRSGNSTIFIAGDCTAVHGCLAAQHKGELAALAIIDDLRETTAASDRKERLHSALVSELAPRPFIDALFRPRPNLYAVPDETVVCRCEEVTAGEIRTLARAGEDNPEKVKSLTRAGMGPCQGRMCSCGVAEIIADETSIPIQHHRPLSVRPPLRNIGLGELATMNLFPRQRNQESAE